MMRMYCLVTCAALLLTGCMQKQPPVAATSEVSASQPASAPADYRAGRYPVNGRNFTPVDAYLAKAPAVAVEGGLSMADEVDSGHASCSGALSGAHSREMNGEKPIERQNAAAASSAVMTVISKCEMPSTPRAHAATASKSARAMP